MHAIYRELQGDMSDEHFAEVFGPFDGPDPDCSECMGRGWVYASTGIGCRSENSMLPPSRRLPCPLCNGGPGTPWQLEAHRLWVARKASA